MHEHQNLIDRFHNHFMTIFIRTTADTTANQSNPRPYYSAPMPCKSNYLSMLSHDQYNHTRTVIQGYTSPSICIYIDRRFLGNIIGYSITYFTYFLQLFLSVIS